MIDVKHLLFSLEFWNMLENTVMIYINLYIIFLVMGFSLDFIGISGFLLLWEM